MVNFLDILENPQINFEKTFEVMRDFRTSRLNPTMYPEFLKTVRALPNIRLRGQSAYDVFNEFNLVDISQDNFTAISKEVMKRGIRVSKICWLPVASPSTCKVNQEGEIIVSAAHSIQNNGILSEISEKGIVVDYTFNKGKLVGEEVQKNLCQPF